MAAKDEKLAEGICKAIYSIDPVLIFMGLAGSVMLEAAERIGLKTASEVFADRAYNDDGSLVARSKPGAVIHDPEAAVARAVKMAKEGKVTHLRVSSYKIARLRVEVIVFCIFANKYLNYQFMKMNQ